MAMLLCINVSEMKVHNHAGENDFDLDHLFLGWRHGVFLKHLSLSFQPVLAQDKEGADHMEGVVILFFPDLNLSHVHIINQQNWLPPYM